jgi:serine phosphatase RsbU (regulator of sigma subunit)
MTHSLKILFLEDNEDDVALLKRSLHKSNLLFISSLATNRDEFVEKLSSFVPDIILSDHSLPQFNSLSALEIVKENCPHVPFVLVTGSVSEEFAVQCIKGGAADYVLKDNLIRLPSIIESALNKKELKTENSIIKGLNNELQNANDIIAQKNKDITDSITYAQRIQQAILPERKLLYRNFPESFILYKPKDIVSGDFYWFTEYKGKFIIAVSDCTGHGVPGSLLSMIGYHLLKNAVYLKDLIDPAEILNEIDCGFRDIFEIGKGSEVINDGMDIAICVIDKAASNLTFSSARRPLYIIKDRTLIEIKGSLLPIGGDHGDNYEKHSFHSETINIEKGDRYFMFTDGFADQFGGDKHKKLKVSGFKELLLKLSDQKMPVYKTMVNDFFEEWKRDEEQTDDILVIGFEVNE